ncbi:M14 family metallopeptidase [Crassaminicella profunda]|uniref:M14 family metallopeptidase n=1 Tax=Crassaminicella profunda TaxID=1286698 RepID=UPI001CA6EC15|nr:M14 family metallocarboxypeptidase [Crassaminicella profunda]QZY53686.1 M14 family metallocarboxypeptidase [Crassaminicella profunda]
MKSRKIYTIMFTLFLIFNCYNISFGEKISIVNPNKTYSYKNLTNDLKILSTKYPDLITYQSIGKSKYDREIWAVKVGHGEATIFLNGAHHAREWITCNLLMYTIDEYANAYEKNTFIDGYDVHNLLDKVSIWFVPMVNPDGVTLQQFGLSSFPKEIHEKLIDLNDGNKNFKRWKANANGIDLNRQYPADWENIKYNHSKPYYKNHKGQAPLVSKEAQALVDFTYEINPEITVSYHSSGRILYWHYKTKPENLKRDKKIATSLSKITGYRLVNPTKNPSGGGYKDWFIQTLNRPSFTIEVYPFVGENNVPASKFNTIWDRNKSAPLYLACEGYDLWKKHTPYKNLTTNNHPYIFTECQIQILKFTTEIMPTWMWLFHQ